mgnify:CR=1 FL=1
MYNYRKYNMKFIDLLRNSELFCGLKENELSSIENLTIKKTVSKNMLLISEGDTSDSMYFIVEGSVNVMVSNKEGEEFILSTLIKGDIFGELSLLDGNPRSANVVTLEKCFFAILRKTDFQELMKNNPTIVTNVITFLCNRIRLVNSLAQSMALMDVYGRLVRLLYDLASPEKDGKRTIEHPLTNQSIAARIGCRRESISRIFSALNKGGYLTTDKDKKKIIINRKLPSAW